jgi:hypothetical protein
MKKTATPLPADFVAYLRGYIKSPHFTSVRRFHRGMILRWTLWSDGIQSNAIPGYATCPPAGRDGLPAGWSYRTFSDIAREAIGTPAIAARRTRAAGLTIR